MLKKIVSMLIVFAMLVPVSSVVAADNSNVQPTIEEILNSYHEKAFAASAEGGSEVSAYARRSGSEKTLEQETVDELTAAGYEAYNVTAENYEELEESLKMDFESMELNPESSYIIVISGEEPNSAGNHSRSVGGGLGSLPEYDMIDPVGGGIPYQYNGRTFTIQFVTMTTTDDLSYRRANTCPLIQNEDDWSIWSCSLEALLSEVISIAVDELVDAVPLGSVASFVVSIIADLMYDDYRVFPALSLNATTKWTRTFTQVYVESESMWKSYLYVERALAKSHLSGYYYSSITGEDEQIPTDEIEFTVYSPHYDDYTFRCEKAIEKYLQGEPGSFYYDKTGDILYIFNGEAVITHADTVGTME